MGEADVARPVLHRGDAAEAREQPKIAAVRRTVDLLLAAVAVRGCDMRGVHPIRQVAVPVELAGGELAAPPLDLDGMIAQPRIAVAGAGDGLLE